MSSGYQHVRTGNERGDANVATNASADQFHEMDAGSGGVLARGRSLARREEQAPMMKGASYPGMEWVPEFCGDDDE